MPSREEVILAWVDDARIPERCPRCGAEPCAFTEQFDPLEYTRVQYRCFASLLLFGWRRRVWIAPCPAAWE